MSYKTLVAILQDRKDAERVLDCAVPLAEHFESHLIGIHAEALPMAYVTPMGAPGVYLNPIDDTAIRERLAEMREFFTERTRASGIASEWRGMESMSGDSAVSGLESARSADLVIAQQNDPDAPSAGIANIEALLFEGGRPVLIVPYIEADAGPVFKKALVAWNGSREAARAAFDALPFLKQADSVEVLTVDAESNTQQDAGMAGAEISAALARHGIEVSLNAATSGDLDHGHVISNRISDAGIDLLVMGGYGQSWLKERLFGGVTRTMLETMTVPTLMSR